VSGCPKPAYGDGSAVYHRHRGVAGEDDYSRRISTIGNQEREGGLTLAGMVERLALDEPTRVTAPMDGDQFKRFVGE
jgi:hypothetical protein